MSLPTIHPGKVLLGEVLARDWSCSETASRIGIDTETIRDLLMEREDLTPELAEKIALATGTNAAFWMRIQEQNKADPVEFTAAQA